MALIASRSPHNGKHGSGTNGDYLEQYEQAIDVTLGTGADLGKIRIWVAATAPLPTTFYWTVYTEAAGLPDNTNVVASGSTTDYTATAGGPIGSDTEYQIDIPVSPAVSLSASTKYWIGIYTSANSFNACFPLNYTQTPLDGAERWVVESTWYGGWYTLAYELYEPEAAPPPPAVPEGDEPQGVRYRAYITGAPDSLPDYELPLISFSARLKSGTPSSVTISLAWDNDAIAAVYARPNGDIQVKRSILYADGTQPEAEIIAAGVDEVREAKGGKNRSWSIRGSRQTTNGSPQTIAMASVNYRAAGAGVVRLRGAVDPTARAADTFTYGSDSVVADTVIISLANGIETMEISG